MFADLGATKPLFRQPNIAIAEHIFKGSREPVSEMLPIQLRPFVSSNCNAKGICTGTALFPPGTELPYHVHACGEAITVLEGEAEIWAAGRKYRLQRLDCIYVPEGTAHRIANPSATQPFLAHTAFPNASPTRNFTDERFAEEDRGLGLPEAGDPENVRRFAQTEVYELAEHTRFYDAFAGRFGSVGICGGYGEFAPGASLPCHTHDFDESITIITGVAVCLVAGRTYTLADYDTAFVPQGRPHRFLNGSTNIMAMFWVYAGSEPERTLVLSGLCDGNVKWPGSPEANDISSAK
jgi:quercetin dioxygenase-like cupin family protein